LDKDLVSEYSETSIGLDQKDVNFVKNEILIPKNNYFLLLELSAPFVIFPFKANVTIVQTKKLSPEEIEELEPKSSEASENQDLHEEDFHTKSLWSAKKDIGKKEQIFEVELTPGTYSLMVAKTDKLFGSNRFISCSVDLCKQKTSETSKSSEVIKQIWKSQEIASKESPQIKYSVDFEAPTSCFLQIRCSSPQIVLGYVSVFVDLERTWKLDVKTLYYYGPTLLRNAGIFVGFCALFSYFWLFMQMILSLHIFWIRMDFVALVGFVYWMISTNQISSLKASILEIDDFGLKTPFQKLKVLISLFLKSEERRKLKILDNEFDNDK